MKTASRMQAQIGVYCLCHGTLLSFLHGGVKFEEFFFYSIEFLVIKSDFLVNKSEFLVNKSEFLVMKSEYRV